MQRINLKKASKENVQEIANLLLTSDYKYEDKLINNFSVESITEFVKNNINFFTIYMVDNKIKGFAIAHTYKNSLNKDSYFKSSDIFSKIKGLFIKKEELILEKDVYYVDFLYFDKSILNKTNALLKYLEVEKIQNNCSKLVLFSK